MKTNRYLPTLITFFILNLSLFGQIHVNSAGSVGIGTNTIANTSKVYITSDGINNNSNLEILKVEYTGSLNQNHVAIMGISRPGTTRGVGGIFKGGQYGVQGIAGSYSDGDKYGVKGTASGGAGGDDSHVYGVHGYAEGGDRSYGVYGEASASLMQNYAGYFAGNVTVTGTVTEASDRRLKENIRDIDNVLDKLMQLEAKQFNYKSNTSLNLPKGNMFGYIAQEIEKVFPDLVTTQFQPLKNNEVEGEDSDEQNYEEYKGVNYIQLIPLLVQGIQEQQKIIDDLTKEVKELKR